MDFLTVITKLSQSFIDNFLKQITGANICKFQNLGEIMLGHQRSFGTLTNAQSTGGDLCTSPGDWRNPTPQKFSRFGNDDFGTVRDSHQIVTR